MFQAARHAPGSPEIHDDRLALSQLAAAESWILIVKRRQGDVRRSFPHQRRGQFRWRPLKQTEIEQDGQAQKDKHRNDEKQPLHVWLSPFSPPSSSRRLT